MTTKIADIYDSIVTKLETILPNFQRVPNPYALDENTAILLRKAFGLAIGPGTNTERYVGCIATWERDYTINYIQGAESKYLALEITLRVEYQEPI